MKWYFKAANPFRLVYEGETPPPATPPATPPETPPATPPETPPAVKKEKKISQEKVNALLAEEKRKNQQVINKQVKELEKLKTSVHLSDQAKNELQTRIEDLQNTLLSKEELAAKETKRLQEEAKKERETLTGEKEAWRNRFMQKETRRALLDEAVKADAFQPNQIVQFLLPNTRLTEVLDGQGNPIPDEYQAKVKFSDYDKEGKPVTLDLTVPEALKRMRDRPSEFGNLFKSGVSGGLGALNRQAPNEKDVSKMSHDEYLKWRESQGLARKKSNWK